jgi:hypothetical protein
MDLISVDTQFIIRSYTSVSDEMRAWHVPKAMDLISCSRSISNVHSFETEFNALMKRVMNRSSREQSWRHGKKGFRSGIRLSNGSFSKTENSSHRMIGGHETGTADLLAVWPG